MLRRLFEIVRPIKHSGIEGILFTEVVFLLGVFILQPNGYIFFDYHKGEKP